MMVCGLVNLQIARGSGIEPSPVSGVTATAKPLLFRLSMRFGSES